MRFFLSPYAAKRLKNLWRPGVPPVHFLRRPGGSNRPRAALYNCSTACKVDDVVETVTPAGELPDTVVEKTKRK